MIFKNIYFSFTFLLVIGSETDMASSGFEDSNSTEPQPQMTLSSTNSSVKNNTASESSQSSTNCPGKPK